jgi:hypothetical protein
MWAANAWGLDRTAPPSPVTATDRLRCPNGARVPSHALDQADAFPAGSLGTRVWLVPLLGITDRFALLDRLGLRAGLRRLTVQGSEWIAD